MFNNKNAGINESEWWLLATYPRGILLNFGQVGINHGGSGRYDYNGVMLMALLCNL